MKNKEDWEYVLVEIPGTYLQDTFMVSRANDGRLGYNVLQLFKPDKSQKVILVNRGWIPGNMANEITKKLGNSAGPENARGILKKSEHFEIKEKQKKFFRAANELQFIDLEDIGRRLDGKLEILFYLEEFIPDDIEISNLYPIKCSRRTYVMPYLTPQKHLDYSIFWGLSTGLGLWGVKQAFKIKK